MYFLYEAAKSEELTCTMLRMKKENLKYSPEQKNEKKKNRNKKKS